MQCHENPGNFMTADELYERLSIDNIYFKASGGGVTFGGGEPLLYSDFISEFSGLNKYNWNIRIETSLNVATSELIKLLQIVDCFYVDIKDLNPLIYKQYTLLDNQYVLDNLRYVSNHSLQGKFIIRLPLIQGFNSIKSVQDSKAYLTELGFNTFDIFEYIVSGTNNDAEWPFRI